MKNDQRGNFILTHFEKYMGEPERLGVFLGLDHDLRSIQIFAFQNFFRDSTVLTSFGLSNFSLEIGEIAEVYCPVDSHVDLAAKVFSNALFFCRSKENKDCSRDMYRLSRRI